MANALFVAFKAKQLGDAGVSGPTVVNWETDTIKISLIDESGGAVDENTHQDWADISTKEVGTAGGVTLTSPTVTFATNTVTIDAADATFTSVTGVSVESLVIWKDDTTDAASTLIVVFDTATGLPVTPNGGNIVSQFNASGIATW
jgi:hypothetical protein